MQIYKLVTQLERLLVKYQKQPARGALRNGCSENMQQIYRISHFSMGVLL